MRRTVGNEEAPVVERLPAPRDEVRADFVGEIGGGLMGLGEREAGEDEDEAVGTHAEGAPVAAQVRRSARRATPRTSSSLPAAPRKSRLSSIVLQPHVHHAQRLDGLRARPPSCSRGSSGGRRPSRDPCSRRRLGAWAARRCAAGRRRSRVAATQPPATSTATLATAPTRLPPSDGSAIARTMISDSEGRQEVGPLASRRARQLAHGQHGDGPEQPAVGAARERQSEAEEEPVEDDEGVGELGRAPARDLDRVDADDGAGQGRRRRGAVPERQASTVSSRKKRVR